jgi:PD-(D/E)XK nuclease family transposase
VLGLTGAESIVSVTIANPYQLPRLAHLKETILDVKAKDGLEREFIVEMQCSGSGSWVKRAVFATCKAIANQLAIGEDYRKIRPVYFIGVLDFNIPWDSLQPEKAAKIAAKTIAKATAKVTPNWLSRFLLKEATTNLQMTQDFSLHFLELPRFSKTLEDCANVVERWAWFFKNAGGQDAVPEILSQEPGFVQAFQTAEHLNWQPEELEEYDSRVQARALHAASLEEREQRGLQKGQLIGIEIGDKQGEERTKRNTARNLRDLGMAPPEIARALDAAESRVREWLA